MMIIFFESKFYFDYISSPPTKMILFSKKFNLYIFLTNKTEKKPTIFGNYFSVIIAKLKLTKQQYFVKSPKYHWKQVNRLLFLFSWHMSPTNISSFSFTFARVDREEEGVEGGGRYSHLLLNIPPTLDKTDSSL